MNAMWDEVSALNLLQNAAELQTPVFFFLGRRDHWVPPATSMAYFAELSAPSKRCSGSTGPGMSPSSTNRPSSTTPWSTWCDRVWRNDLRSGVSHVSLERSAVNDTVTASTTFIEPRNIEYGFSP